MRLGATSKVGLTWASKRPLIGLKSVEVFFGLNVQFDRHTQEPRRDSVPWQQFSAEAQCGAIDGSEGAGSSCLFACGVSLPWLRGERAVRGALALVDG